MIEYITSLTMVDWVWLAGQVLISIVPVIVYRFAVRKKPVSTYGFAVICCTSLIVFLAVRFCRLYSASIGFVTVSMIIAAVCLVVNIVVASKGRKAYVQEHGETLDKEETSDRYLKTGRVPVLPEGVNTCMKCSGKVVRDDKLRYCTRCGIIYEVYDEDKKEWLKNGR